MPNRVIRESILTSDRYVCLPTSDHRLLFLELLLCADDYGLVPLNISYIARRTTSCYGKSNEIIAGLLLPLVDADLIRPYDGPGGGKFAFIPRFNNPGIQALKPRWPLPPESVCGSSISDAMQRSKGLYRKAATEKNQADSVNAPVAKPLHTGYASVVQPPYAYANAKYEVPTNIPNSVDRAVVDFSKNGAVQQADSKPEPPEPRASRFALSLLPDPWREFCERERPDLDPVRVFDRFADYWRAKPGAAGRKLDWLATWRNWVRTENASAAGKNGGQSVADVIAAIKAREGES